MRSFLALLAALLLGALAWSLWQARRPLPGSAFPPSAEPPRRILPANAGAADLCLALVEPGRVAALPEAAQGYSRIGQEGGAWSSVPRFHGFDVESLLVHRPDLVVAHGWQSPETLASLRQSGVDVLVLPLPRTWGDVRDALLVCGRAFGAEARAAEVLADLDRRVELLQAAAGAERLAALSYVNLGTGGWAAGAGTTADILFDLAGLRNAAAEMGLEGHATLDLEALLVLDPDVIVVGLDEDEPVFRNSLFEEVLAVKYKSIRPLLSKSPTPTPPPLYKNSCLSGFRESFSEILLMKSTLLLFGCTFTKRKLLD